MIAIEKAASRRQFYALLDEAGVKHRRAETFLSIVEGHAASALAELLSGRLSPGQRTTLALFFALMTVRTPRAAGLLEARTDQINRMIFGGRLSHPDVFARDYHEAIGDDAPAEEIEALRLEMLTALAEGRMVMDDPRAHAIGLGLSISGDLASSIYPLNWTLLESEIDFVTSDVGLAMIDPAPRFPWTGNAWASGPRCETTIPLGRKHCLLVTPGDEARFDALEIDAAATDVINLRTYGFADQYIYGATQEVVTGIRALAKRRPRDVAKPRRDHQVILIAADPSDTTYADRRHRQGWPPYLMTPDGRFDYFVVDIDGTADELGALTSRLARERPTARKS